jgi:hypothetical protein
MTSEGPGASERGDYPRPQMVRDGWTDLNGLWDFAYDDEDRGGEDGWYRPGHEAFTHRIRVPFPPESSASGIDDPGSMRSFGTAALPVYQPTSASNGSSCASAPWIIKRLSG